MVILKTKVIIDGQEVEVPVFQTRIKPGKEVTEDVMDSLHEEEQIEKEIQFALEEIRRIVKKFKRIEKNLDYFYEVGKILQFVDKKNYRKIRGRIWQRIAHDLEPSLLLGKVKTKKIGRSPQTESKRNIEDMYQLAKFPRGLLYKASWNQWDEILKFKEVREDKTLLDSILDECQKGLSGISLRNKIKGLREELKIRAKKKKK